MKNFRFIACVLVAAAIFSTLSFVTAKAQGAASIKQSFFGSLPNGDVVTQYTLTNKNGIEVSIITYGGIITSLKVPDKNGVLGDIVLGHETLEGYLKNTSYFGALIGRYGNRIGGAEFTIDGTKYTLDKNNGENTLHVGLEGFDKKNWYGTPFAKDGTVGLKLALLSPDGDQGFPGNLNAEVTYSLQKDDELVIEYKAITDKPTHVNMTAHSYFNLEGTGDILSHELMIPADNITPVDEGLIPTGELQAVEGTPFDFREATTIGKRINETDEQLKFGLGYDHNYALNKSEEGAFELAAKVVDPSSGRVLEIFSEEPGIQFYSGNFLDGSLEGKGHTYTHRTGFCLEPQHFPDSPNKPQFASTLLRPGETYSTKMSYKFSTVE